MTLDICERRFQHAFIRPNEYIGDVAVMEVSIERIDVDVSGSLLVVPTSGSERLYHFIYRAGKGIQWEPVKHAFLAAEPSRWAHWELYGHIQRVVLEECGDSLRLTDATSWSGISSKLKSALLAYGR